MQGIKYFFQAVKLMMELWQGEMLYTFEPENLKKFHTNFPKNFSKQNGNSWKSSRLFP